MGFHDFVLAVVVIPANLTVVLNVVIERAAKGREGIESQSDRGLQVWAQIERTIDPTRILPSSALFFVIFGQYLPFCRLHIIERCLQSSLQLVLAQDDMEILSQAGLTDMAFIPEVHPQEVHTVVRQIVAVVGSCLGVRIPFEVMQPFQIECHIAPADVSHLIHSRTVVAGEEGKEQLVLRVEHPVEFRVDIVEIKGIVPEILRGFQKKVHIGTTSRHQQRSLILRDRPFDGAFG